MKPETLQRIESVYTEALSLSATDRPAFLERTCGNDIELRKEVESLLACEKEAENYLDKPAFQDMAESLSKGGADILVDRMVGRYHLLSLVGRGGMAEVYCAVDTKLNRLVAVKILPAYMADTDALQRFEREARAIAALNHRHICTVHDVGHDGGVHYLVFEYLIGESLSDRLRRGPVPLVEGLQHALEIADGLADAHDIGIIHLDLKPENIMLTRSGAKLLDFGIAELRYPDAPPTDTSSGKSDKNRPIPGTLGFMAPEQADGHDVDCRADIFAFGAVLYQMFTGRSAFPTKDFATVPPPISEVQPHLPRDLDVIICRCLAHAPCDRWPSIEELRSELRRILAERA